MAGKVVELKANTGLCVCVFPPLRTELGGCPLGDKMFCLEACLPLGQKEHWWLLIIYFSAKNVTGTES